MTAKNSYDAIIIGGSYAGLSAAMALGRSLRQVLIIDSGNPCNRQTPHSHNFITQDGETPAAITAKAKAQVLQYETVQFFSGLATSGKKTDLGFEIKTQSGDVFSAKKLLFATGVTDIMPEIDGFKACWGISVLHCPYCHGYEVKHQHMGLLGNGDFGFEFARLLSNWTKQLTLFTNGKSTLTTEQQEKLQDHNISTIETEIAALDHSNGQIRHVLLKDNTQIKITALFTKPGFTQHCDIPQTLGCELTEHGYIKVDDFHKTSVPGIYAAGDNTTMFRAVAGAVAAGNKAGALLNKELIEQSF
jgi:thioredoxin reductase